MPAQSKPSAIPPKNPPKYVDVLLYASAAVSYIGLSIYNKWLLDWIVGPLWLVALGVGVALALEVDPAPARSPAA